MSTLKVNNIQNASGTDAISIGSDGSLSYPNIGRRNLIINGAMQVAQRGTSFTATGYTVDRFAFNEATDGAVTITQSSEAPANFASSLKVDVTTADASLGSTQNLHLYQNIEGQNITHLNFGSADAQSLMFSFWVRSSKTGTYSIVFENSGADRCYVSDYSISTANTWEKKTITLTADTTGTWLISNGVGLRIRFGLASGTQYTTSSTDQWLASDKVGSTNMVNFMDSTSNDFYLTGVQLEVGSVATPFEHRSYGEELALCQRYYQVVVNGNDNSVGSGTPYANGDSLYVPWQFKQEFRTTPSMISSGSGTFRARHGNNVSFAGFTATNGINSRNATLVTATVSGSVVGDYYWLESDAATALLAFDAEL